MKLGRFGERLNFDPVLVQFEPVALEVKYVYVNEKWLPPMLTSVCTPAPVPTLIYFKSWQMIPLVSLMCLCY